MYRPTILRSAILALALLPSCRGMQERSTPPSVAPFKVAAVQFNPAFKELEGNLEKLAARFEDAARAGAKIIVAPEMATTGYLYTSRDDVSPFVDTIPGKTTRRFERISRRYGCYLAWGMAEVDPGSGLYYNSSALVGPEGYIGRYRKTHLWEAEAHWAAWGNEGMPVFKTPLGTLALIICQDANHVETFRRAMVSGADIVCFMTNSSGQTIGHLQARAIQNGLYVVSANRSLLEKDFEMKGCSAVWSPSGEKLAEAGVDTLETVAARVDPARYREKERLKRARKPSLYLDLAGHIGPWDSTATKAPRKVFAAAVQFEPVIGSKESNLSKVNAILKSARAKFADPSVPRLIVLPELTFTGPVSPARVENLAEPVGGPLTSEVMKMARRFNATVVFGLIEKDGERFYNSVVAVAPDGRMLGRARKVHLSPSDREWASPGTRFEVLMSDPLGRLGLLVGADAYVAESGLLLAVKRADIVAIPSSWHGEVAGKGAVAINPAINPHAAKSAMIVWDNLASTCFYWTVVANFVGTERRYGGRSGIYSLDPIYKITSPALARTNSDEVVMGTFTTLGLGHWITQDLYINSRRADDFCYPLIRSREPARTNR